MPTTVNSWNDFDPLKHIIVGRADHSCIPGWEPASEAKIDRKSDMWGMWGPRALETVEKANEELDYFVNVLESLGGAGRPTIANTMESAGRDA